MSKDLEMDAFEVSQVTGISIKAAQALVGQCYDAVGGYSLGWCIDRFDDAKRKARRLYFASGPDFGFWNRKVGP